MTLRHPMQGRPMGVVPFATVASLVAGAVLAGRMCSVAGGREVETIETRRLCAYSQEMEWCLLIWRFFKNRLNTHVCFESKTMRALYVLVPNACDRFHFLLSINNL